LSYAPLSFSAVRTISFTPFGSVGKLLCWILDAPKGSAQQRHLARQGRCTFFVFHQARKNAQFMDKAAPLAL
jgi:hypothetical protein